MLNMYIFFCTETRNPNFLMMNALSPDEVCSYLSSSNNPAVQPPPVPEPMEVSSNTNNVPFGVSPLKRPEGYVPKKVQDSQRRGRGGQPNYMRFGVICHVCRKFGHRARHCRLRLPPPQPTSPPVPLMSIDFDKADEPKSKSSTSVTLILFEPDPLLFGLRGPPPGANNFLFFNCRVSRDFRPNPGGSVG